MPTRLTKWLYKFTLSTVLSEHSGFSSSPPTLISHYRLLVYFPFHHHCRCVVKSIFGFNLRFCDDWRSWTHFHTLVGFLDIPFCKIFVWEFLSIFDWVCVFFLYWPVRVLCIFRIDLSRYTCYEYLFPLHVLPLYSLISVFWWKESLNFIIQFSMSF